MSDIRNKIFDKYYEYRSVSADMNDKSKLKRHYDRVVKYNYIPFFRREYKSLLEIGCYTGYTLQSLTDLKTFSVLEGLEISPSAAKIARENTGLTIYTEDAFKFLPNKKATYDVIIMKAVLEHIIKEKSGMLLNLIYQSLKPGGVAILSVPNMDWISATHERYMDLTHETGYTIESFNDIMNMYFDKTQVRTMKYDFIYGIGSFVRIVILQPLVKLFIKSIYKILGQGAYRRSMFDRSLIAAGWKNKTL